MSFVRCNPHANQKQRKSLKTVSVQYGKRIAVFGNCSKTRPFSMTQMSEEFRIVKKQGLFTMTNQSHVRQKATEQTGKLKAKSSKITRTAFKIAQFRA
jgi:hypothetical protein